MTVIKSYTLKYYCLGNPIKDNLFKVYLRYYVTLVGKTQSANLNTGYTMTKVQVKMLNANELSGVQQNDLNKIKSNILQIVEGLNAAYNTYPTPEQLKEFLTDMQHEQPMEQYISDYLKGLKIKGSTKRLYSSRLQHWKKFYSLNLTKTPIQSLINKVTIEKFGFYLKNLHVATAKQPIGDIQIFHLQSEAIRLLNTIAEKQNLLPIPYYLSMPKISEQYTPSDDEFEQLVSIECIGTTKMVQDLIYINSFIGIRVDELLNIKKGNITFFNNHVIIHFTDFKNSKARDVVLMDRKAIDLLKFYVKTSGEDKLVVFSVETFNNNLKKLAQLAFDGKSVYLYNTKKENDVKYIISDIISSHCIRRYAIIKNIEKYGIDVARTFSGHSSYEIVVRHYAKEFLDKKAVLEKMKGGY